MQYPWPESRPAGVTRRRRRRSPAGPCGGLRRRHRARHRRARGCGAPRDRVAQGCRVLADDPPVDRPAVAVPHQVVVGILAGERTRTRQNGTSAAVGTGGSSAAPIAAGGRLPIVAPAPTTRNGASRAASRRGRAAASSARGGRAGPWRAASARRSRGTASAARDGGRRDRAVGPDEPQRERAASDVGHQHLGVQVAPAGAVVPRAHGPVERQVTLPCGFGLSTSDRTYGSLGRTGSARTRSAGGCTVRRTARPRRCRRSR